MNYEKEQPVKWPTDGHHHRMLDNEHVYVTNAVKNYLTSDRVQFLISGKGMGKTLLLRYKRQETTKLAKEGIDLLPENGELDTPSFNGKYKIDYKEMYEVEFWADLWYFSIVISTVIFSFSRKSSVGDKKSFMEQLQSLPIGKSIITEAITRITKKEQWSASDILSEMLVKSRGVFIKNRGVIHNRIRDMACSWLLNGYYYFIDSIDTALKSGFNQNVDIWITGQQGLVLATYMISQDSEHLKVYGTIRQEAWNVFLHEDRQAISGRILNLTYNKRQLEEMFNHSIQVYEGRETISDMTRLTQVTNYSCNSKGEDVFSYIHRHTNYTPRALSVMGRGISEAEINLIGDDRERNEELRKVVNELSGRIVVTDFLLSHQQIFLSSISGNGDVGCLAENIPSNVLPGWSLESINYWYAKKKGKDISLSHPFCELYNLGLVGEVGKSIVSTNRVQKFRVPNEFTRTFECNIDKDSLYFLHPGLSSYVRDSPNSKSFEESKVLVGQGELVPEWLLADLPTIFISHKSEDKNDVLNWMDHFKKYIDIKIPNKLWIDHEDIPYGGNIKEYVEKGLKHAALMFLFATKNALQSEWVDMEWEAKKYGEIDEKRIYIIVVLGIGVKVDDLPDYLQQKKNFHYNDMVDEDSMRRLARNCAECIRSPEGMLEG